MPKVIEILFIMVCLAGFILGLVLHRKHIECVMAGKKGCSIFNLYEGESF